jgi:hypothetical protein
VSALGQNLRAVLDAADERETQLRQIPGEATAHAANRLHRAIYESRELLRHLEPVLDRVAGQAREALQEERGDQ